MLTLETGRLVLNNGGRGFLKRLHTKNWKLFPTKHWRFKYHAVPSRHTQISFRRYQSNWKGYRMSRSDCFIVLFCN